MKRVALAGFSLACVCVVCCRWSSRPRCPGRYRPRWLRPRRCAAARTRMTSPRCRPGARVRPASGGSLFLLRPHHRALRVPVLRPGRDRASRAAQGRRPRHRLRVQAAGPDTLLLTNDHVADWPAVTDAQHVVDGVPSAASASPSRWSWSTTSTTPTSATTSRSRAWSPIRSWTWPCSRPTATCTCCRGRSAAARAARAQRGRGARIPAGRVPRHQRGQGDLRARPRRLRRVGPRRLRRRRAAVGGNSGSPVLAVSCTTGEYELVGIFHAGYTEGSALNVVIGIDQVRDLMTTLKRTPHEHVADVPALDGVLRAHLDETLASEREIFFPFGANVAVLRRASPARCCSRSSAATSRRWSSRSRWSRIWRRRRARGPEQLRQPGPRLVRVGARSQALHARAARRRRRSADRARARRLAQRRSGARRLPRVAAPGLEDAPDGGPDPA